MHSSKRRGNFRGWEFKQITKNDASVGYEKRVSQKLVSSLLGTIEFVDNFKKGVLMVNFGN